MPRLGPGTWSLVLNAGAWLLYALGLMLGGMDPGADAVALVVISYVTGASALLVGLIGVVARRELRRSVAGVVLGIVWMGVLAGWFGPLFSR